MREMTITQGLAELKLLDARINKATHQDAWCFVETNAKATDEYKAQRGDELKARWESLMALIKERGAIKSAIVASNAVTKVEIGSLTMTVAEAIDYKMAIAYERAICAKLYIDLSTATERADAMNARVQSRIDATMQNLASSGAQNIAEAQKAIFENYMEKNGCQVVDPLNAKQRADELKARMDEFEKNVDIALSVSNATTIITI